MYFIGHLYYLLAHHAYFVGRLRGVSGLTTILEMPYSFLKGLEVRAVNR